MIIISINPFSLQLLVCLSVCKTDLELESLQTYRIINHQMISSHGIVPLYVTGTITIRSWLMLLPPVKRVALWSPWQIQTALLLLSSLRYTWHLSCGAGLLYVRYGKQEETPVPKASPTAPLVVMVAAPSGV
jgi:hypothetical protein